MKRTSDPNAIVTCLNLRLGLIQTISIIGHNRNQHHCANGRRKKCTYSTSVHKYGLLFPMLCQAIFFIFGTNIIRFLFPVF